MASTDSATCRESKTTSVVLGVIAAVASVALIVALQWDRGESQATKELRLQLKEMSDQRVVDAAQIQELTDCVRIYNAAIGTLKDQVDYWRKQKLDEVNRAIDKLDPKSGPFQRSN